jgi:hypothetical protein
VDLINQELKRVPLEKFDRVVDGFHELALDVIPRVVEDVDAALDYGDFHMIAADAVELVRYQIYGSETRAGFDGMKPEDFENTLNSMAEFSVRFAPVLFPDRAAAADYLYDQLIAAKAVIEIRQQLFGVDESDAVNEQCPDASEPDSIAALSDLLIETKVVMELAKRLRSRRQQAYSVEKRDGGER